MRVFKLLDAWATRVLFFALLCAAPSQAQVESTGFEASDGWDAGYSICGPEFAATCSPPVMNHCVFGDHATNENCCIADPNVDTGWYMRIDSHYCREPHIDTAHPFSGAQHLRFSSEPDVSGSSGCQAPVLGCLRAVYTPLLAPFPHAPTVVSFRVAMSGYDRGFLSYLGDTSDDPAGASAFLGACPVRS